MFVLLIGFAFGFFTAAILLTIARDQSQGTKRLNDEHHRH